MKFKQLKAKWDRKLAKSGFNDIEHGDKLLRHDGDWFHKHINTLQYENTTKFYNQCVRFLTNHEFQTKEHEHIWMLFSEGETLEEIENHVTIKKSMIANVINQYIKIMHGK